MVYAGRIDSVYFARAGGEVTVAAATGTQVISVGFPVDFDVSGGTLQHNATGNLYAYTTVDIVNETVTLTAVLPSGRSFAVGDMLNVRPLSTDARALVNLYDSQDEAPIDARITHALRPLLAEGARDPGMGESVIVDIVGNDWVVTDLSGEIPTLEIDAATLRGDDFVINSAGTFYYWGTPELGNLVQSSAQFGGTDDYGNAYLEGVACYFPSGSPLFAQQFNGVDVQFYTASSAAGPWTSQGGSNWNVSGGLNLFSIINAGTELLMRSDGFVQLTGAGGLWLSAPSPANVVSDTILANVSGTAASWQGLGSGTGVSGFTAANSRYLILPTGFVHVDLRVNFASAGTGPVTFANAIPAAYRPSGSADIRQAMSQSSPSGALAHAFVSQSTGVVEIVAVSPTATLLGNYDVQFEYAYI